MRSARALTPGCRGVRAFAPVVHRLSAEEAADIDRDEVQITDGLAHVFVLTFRCDFFILDAPSSAPRLIQYLDDANCLRMLRGHRHDVDKPSHALSNRHVRSALQSRRWSRALPYAKGKWCRFLVDFLCNMRQTSANFWFIF